VQGGGGGGGGHTSHSVLVVVVGIRRNGAGPLTLQHRAVWTWLLNKTMVGGAAHRS